MNHLNFLATNIDSKDQTILDELINYLIENPSCFIDINKILRQHSLSHKKIESYFKILEDAEIGKRIFMFPISGIDLISHFKFYFFSNEIFKSRNKFYRPDQDGALLEQYFYSRLKANSNFQLLEIYLFRTVDGVEIDFIIKNQSILECIEIKKDQFIYAGDFKSLHFFDQKFPQLDKELYVLHNGIRDQKEGKVQVIPMAKYLET